MDKLLLVEDDEALAIGMEFTLRDEGYEVIKASTLEESIKLFEKERVDLIILDINLPDGNGYDLCKYVRKKGDMPIIFLTALDEEINVVMGFEIGGDDYITKPFRVRELLSRIKAVMRRKTKSVENKKQYVSDGITIDIERHSVYKNGQEIIVTAQEYRLLLIFMNRSEVIINRDEILKELMDCSETFYDENTLSVYIKRIREKIEDIPRNPGYIITVRGLGYKWDKPVVKG